ncbi:MAG: hypothetical protein HZB41_11025 [Ignavibacteriae bacterium]|nr:hypothetical protein [Ignavibacteriota bacterium]
MKKINYLLLWLFAAGLILGISSCTKEPLTSPNTTEDSFSSKDFELIIIDNTESDFSDCDESSMIIMLPAYGYSDDDCESMGWKHEDNGNHYGQYKHNFKKEKRGYKIHLGFVLRNLNLTTEQIDSIKIYIQDHISCVKTQMILLRDSERAIIDSANQERQELIDSAKNGGWTREQLRDSLKSLNQRTRAALRDNPVRLEVCVELKACRLDLFTRIETILTPEQYIIWLEWKDKFPEIKCGN